MGDSARSAVVQRNAHLLGMEGRNFAPHDSVVGRVEVISAVRGSATRQVLRRRGAIQGIPPELLKLSELPT